MGFTSKKLLALFCAAGASTYLVGCDNSGTAPDARVISHFDAGGPDAGPADAGAPDAADRPLEGALAVLNVRTVGDLTPVPPLAGGVISISFTDKDTDTGTEVINTGLIGCEVHVYDVTTHPAQHPPVEVDQGAVTVTGTLSPAGVCSFNAGAGKYICIAGPPTDLPAGTVVGAGPQPGTATIFNAMIDWSTIDPAGMTVQLSGFATAANNGSFPVLAVADGPSPPFPANNHHVLVVANPAVVAETTVAAASALFIAAAQPTPIQRPFLGPNADITINKVAGAIIGAITNVVLSAPGGADPSATPPITQFDLADSSVQPEAMPKTAPAGNLTVTCMGAGGSCGVLGTTGQKAFIVTGHTTDGAIAGLPKVVMPPATHKFATFACNALSDTAVTIPKAVWEAVLGSSPTRIETRVIRGRAKLSAIPNVNVVVGNSVVGWTDIP